MLTRRFSIAAAILVATAIGAWGGETALAESELRSILSGKKVRQGNDGIATYGSDGRYEIYGLNTGHISKGTWTLQGNRVCVTFSTGERRCDEFLRDGDALFIKDSKGNRRPAKPL